MSSVPRPKVHDETTATALLDAAAGLLRSGGPAAVSVRAAAQACGISFRGVYALFGSKQALIDALAERGYRSLATGVRSVQTTDDPARDLVLAGVEGFRRFALSDPEIFRLTFERVSSDVLHQRAVGVAAIDAYNALAERIGRARAGGSIHPDRSDQACVFAFHSFCQGLASTELAGKAPPEGTGMWPVVEQVDMAALWRDALTGLVAGFATAPEVPQ